MIYGYIYILIYNYLGSKQKWFHPQNGLANTRYDQFFGLKLVLEKINDSSGYVYQPQHQNKEILPHNLLSWLAPFGGCKGMFETSTFRPGEFVAAIRVIVAIPSCHDSIDSIHYISNKRVLGEIYGNVMKFVAFASLLHHTYEKYPKVVQDFLLVCP